MRKRKTFADANGKDWQVNVTPSERDQIRDQTGVELYDLVRKDTASKIIERFETDDDFVRQVAGIVSGCDPNLLYGELLNDVLEALFEALIDFYRTPQQKQIIRSTLKLMQTAAEKAAEIAPAIGGRIDEAIAGAIREIDIDLLVEKSTNSATSWQDSPASTSNNPTETDHGGIRSGS